MSNSKALSTIDPNSITSLSQLEETFRGQPVNLLLPKTIIGELPPGTRPIVRSVQINKADDSHVYSVEGGKKALTKHGLDLIANAAGISWISEKRIDDRRHPHYCEFEVMGEVNDFDGSKRIAVGTKTIDLRDDAGNGMPGRQAHAIIASAQKKKRDPLPQLTKAREYMTEMCASKARNRAIAAILGIKRAYRPQELDKPFIIPKLILDGSNPQAQQAIFANMMGATQALFSRPEPQQNDGRVIEASLDRVSVPDNYEDDDFPIDPETGELEQPPLMVDDGENLQVRLGAIYKRARNNGIDINEWKSIVWGTTNKRDYEQLTSKDLDNLQGAIDARIANGGE